jgi:periplasmic protein CpxP/Spy
MKPTFSLLSLSLLFTCGVAFAAQAPAGQQPAPGAPAQQPAQQPAGQPQAAPDQGTPLNKLDLSNDQKKQIHEIRRQSQQQVATVRGDTSLTQQQQAQQVRQIRHKASQQVDSVLTPDQLARYEAWRKSHQRQHHAAKTQPS